MVFFAACALVKCNFSLIHLQLRIFFIHLNACKLSKNLLKRKPACMQFMMELADNKNQAVSFFNIWN